jgi:type IV pilus assembly protein PilW
MKTTDSKYLAIVQPFPHERGFSLIELMIALGIGLFLLAGLFYIYSNAAQSFRTQSALAYMQSNARFAFEIMGVDIRQAGFFPTRKDETPVNIVNTLTSCNNNLKDLFSIPLVGYESSEPPDVCTTASTTACYLANTDSLTVVRADNENRFKVSTYTPGAFTLALASWPSNPPEVGEIFLATDPSHAAVFQVDTITPPSLTFGVGGAASPGNSGADLGVFNGTSSLVLMRLSGVSYYIGLNPAGEPALYRDKMTRSGTSADGDKEELIQGVEDMEITYGVDTNDPVDRNVNAYWTATQVAAGTDGTLTMPAAGAPSSYWRRVLSVRITLTLVSAQDERVATTTSDRRLRRTFTNTIAVRNRLQ